MADRLERQIEERIEALGYELVELERAGPKTRPILRIRVDRADATEEAGVTVAECAKVSRALEAYLDEAEDIPERYTLEVSSPGVERPLTRARDFERFAGRDVMVKTQQKLANGTKRVEGELLGLASDDGEERVRLRLKDGSEVDIPRANVARAHLIFRWEDRR
ncbi:MAG TPA: ribosome maturation factor RimP [Longimicrobiales bacterium]|nr:ribosome maturation factor RimP [Longimicrobiales bacterium]